MPVEDHATSEKVKIDSSWRYGCWNRQGYKDGYLAIDGLTLGMLGNTREVSMSFVANNMSKECRFDKSLSDPACEGCKWRGSGEAYDQKVRLAAEGS